MTTQDSTPRRWDRPAEDDWLHADGQSVLSSASSLPVTGKMQNLSIERDWDLLSSASGSHDSDSVGNSIQQQHSQNGDDMQLQSQSTFDLSLLEDWRRVTGETAATPSEAGVSELSAVSSNAFDPVFFPERNATPTNKAPQRGCSTRHNVLCQLCSEEIRGMRYMCKECPQWSVCTDCFVVSAEHEVHPIHTFIRIYSPTDIFTVQGQPEFGLPAPRSQARDTIGQPTIHLDIDCHNCKGSIIGVRYDCAVSYCHQKGISFCQDCEALPINCHPSDHPLIKYKLTKETSRPLFGDDSKVPDSRDKDTHSPEILTPQARKRHLDALNRGASAALEGNAKRGSIVPETYAPEQAERHYKLSKATLPDPQDFEDGRGGGISWMLENLKRPLDYKAEASDKEADPPIEDDLLQNLFESRNIRSLAE